MVELIVNGKVGRRRRTCRPTTRRTTSSSTVPIAQEQLGGAAAVPAAAHQPGGRARRRQADPGVAGERQWCIGVIEQLWRMRAARTSPPAEREEAEQTFQKAIEIYRKIAEESEEGS